MLRALSLMLAACGLETTSLGQQRVSCAHHGEAVSPTRRVRAFRSLCVVCNQDAVRALVSRAVAGGESGEQHCETLTAEEVTELVLHCAWHDFDEKLAQHVGSFQYVGGDKPTITFRRAHGQSWGADQEQRLRAPELKAGTKGHFAVVARVCLHHNTSSSIDAQAVLLSMGRTLHVLSGL